MDERLSTLRLLGVTLAGVTIATVVESVLVTAFVAPLSLVTIASVLAADTFEGDPNVTDEKYPCNPTRSYRSSEPLRILGEVHDWTQQKPEALRGWWERIAALVEDDRGEIIN